MKELNESQINNNNRCICKYKCVKTPGKRYIIAHTDECVVFVPANDNKQVFVCIKHNIATNLTARKMQLSNIDIIKM